MLCLLCHLIVTVHLRGVEGLLVALELSFLELRLLEGESRRKLLSKKNL